MIEDKASLFAFHMLYPSRYISLKINPQNRRYEVEKRKLERLQEGLQKLQVKETDKEENKTIALGTSKLNYLDPRITVAW